MHELYIWNIFNRFSIRFCLVEVILLYLIIASVCKDILYNPMVRPTISPFSYIGNHWRQKVTDDWTEAWILQKCLYFEDNSIDEDVHKIHRKPCSGQFKMSLFHLSLVLYI